MSQLFTSGGQSFEASASASVLPMNSQGLISFRIDWFDLLAVQGDSQEFAPAPHFESINSSVHSLLYGPTFISIHDYWKKHSFDYMNLISKVMSLLFITLSRFVMVFLPKSKHLLISWLQSPSAVILKPKKIKSVTLIPPLLFSMK